DRDCGDRTVRGQFPGETGNGGAAGADCLAAGSGPGYPGCFRMVRTWRGNAKGGRNLCVPAGGIWGAALGSAHVIPVCVANIPTRATFRRVGVDRIRELRGVSSSIDDGRA